MSGAAGNGPPGMASTGSQEEGDFQFDESSTMSEAVTASVVEEPGDRAPSHLEDAFAAVEANVLPSSPLAYLTLLHRMGNAQDFWGDDPWQEVVLFLQGSPGPLQNRLLQVGSLFAWLAACGPSLAQRVTEVASYEAAAQGVQTPVPQSGEHVGREPERRWQSLLQINRDDILQLAVELLEETRLASGGCWCRPRS